MFKPHHFLLIFSTVFFYLCSFGYLCLFCLYGGNTVSWRAAVHPSELHSHSCHVGGSEISHGGSISTAESGKCTIWGPSLPRHQEDSTGYDLGEAAPTSRARTRVWRQEWLSREGGRSELLAVSTHSSREMKHGLDEIIWTGANSKSFDVLSMIPPVASSLLFI